MAWYNKASAVTHTGHGDPFNVDYKPGQSPLLSGIYRCKNCGDEIAANGGNPLPPQNHHQHAPGTPIVWQLSVWAVQKQ